MKQTDIFREAIEKYGVEKQLDQTVEELAELIVAINKLKRAGMVSKGLLYFNDKSETQQKALSNLVGEIADVKNMVCQLEMMLKGIVGPNEIKEAAKVKVSRLKNRMLHDKSNEGKQGRVGA